MPVPIDPRWLRDFLESYLNRGRYKRLIRDRFFQGYVTAVTAKATTANNEAGTQYECSVQKIGDTSAGSMTYTCVTPGYKPVVGDLVECMWRDEHVAYVLWPVNGTTPASAAYASQIIAGTQVNISPTTGIGAVTVNWTDPTTSVGDLIIRDQSGLDRLAPGAAGSLLTIKNLGNYARTCLALNPLAYYRLNEASGTTMADNTTNARNGTYSASGVTYSATGATGDGDHAVSYDNVNGYSSVANMLPNGDFSVAFFFNTTMTTGFKDDQSRAQIVGTDNGSAGGGTSVLNTFDIGIYGTSHPAGVSTGQLYYSSKGSLGSNDLATPSTFNNGAWHHVVVVYSNASGAVTMYVDGASQSLNSVGPSRNNIINPSAPGSVAFGAFINRTINGAIEADYTGSLDEVALFNYALSSAQASSLYAQVSAAASPTPIWKVRP